MKRVLRPVAEKRPTVAIVFRYVHHYRARFFDLLKDRLAERGVTLRLVVGEPGPRERARRDAVELPWATRIVNRYWQFGGHEFVWQPAWRHVRDADLVVLEQASRLLFNYVALIGREAGGPRVALWGHGRNVQPHRASRSGEAVKRWFSRRVDWWFAYNERSVEAVRALGVPAHRITCVENAVDTRGMQALLGDIGEEERRIWRKRLGVVGGHVAVFTGALYSDKRLDFLVAAADVVRRKVPDFELLVIGAGPQDGLVAAAARERPWLHAAGPLYGRDKIAAMSLARCLALPGAVGLAVLDGFALGLPLVTCDVPFHGDEIAYLEDGVNGVVVRDAGNPAAYADALARVLTDDELAARLREGCAAAARRYTVEAMAENFAEGVLQALNTFNLRP